MSMTDIATLAGAIIVLGLIGVVFYYRAIKH